VSAKSKTSRYHPSLYMAQASRAAIHSQESLIQTSFAVESTLSLKTKSEHEVDLAIR
jgi:predicted ABC-type ATPase